MNGLERAKLAFQHQEADRVPIFELTIDNPTAQVVLGRENLCGFGGRVRGVAQNEAILRGDYFAYHRQRMVDSLDLWEALDLDVFPLCDPIPVNPSVPEQVDERTWRFEESPGFWRICRYSPAGDVYDQVDSFLRQEGLPAMLRLTEHLEASSPRLEDWDFSLVDMVIERFGGKRMIMGSADVEIGSTYDWAEVFLIGLIEAPSLIERYLDAKLKATLMLAEALLERGVDGLHGGFDWASAKGLMFSPRHFRRFVFPRIQKITDLCHRYGKVYVKHTDGNVNAIIEDMIQAGIDGYQAIEPGAGMDIRNLKRQYGDRLTLIGNVDCAGVLVYGPLEAVRQQTMDVISAAAPGGGFLLSTSNSVHPGVQPEYYFEMIRTAREVGIYPIQIG